MQRDSAAFVPALCRGAGEGSASGAARIKGDILFRKREYPLWNPKRKALIGSLDFERLLCLRNENTCARQSRVSTARRFDYLLLSAVAQPLAALLPYGCGTPLAGAALPIL